MTGFQCQLPKASDPLVDPVSTLQSYIQKTDSVRASNPHSPVLLSLNKPYNHLSAAGIASVLSDAIRKAGLAGKGFTPRSFRTTGAQAAVDVNIDPKTAQQQGRWKSEAIFYIHYVHSKLPTDYTDRLFTHE